MLYFFLWQKKVLHLNARRKCTYIRVRNKLCADAWIFSWDKSNSLPLQTSVNHRRSLYIHPTLVNSRSPIPILIPPLPAKFEEQWRWSRGCMWLMWMNSHPSFNLPWILCSLRTPVNIMVSIFLSTYNGSEIARFPADNPNLNNLVVTLAFFDDICAHSGYFSDQILLSP